MYKRKRRYSKTYPRKIRKYSYKSAKYRRFARINRRKRYIRKSIRRGGPVLHIRKLLQGTYVLPNTGALASKADNWNYKLSDVSAQCPAEIAMYQFYKISKIVITIRPRFTVVGENAVGIDGYNFGYLGSGIDYSGQLGSYSSLADVFDDCTGKITPGFRKHTRVFKPKVAKMLYAGVATTQYENQNSGWIDTNDEDVFHYGLRTYWEGQLPTTVGGNAVSVVYDYFAKYYISFKQRNK